MQTGISVRSPTQIGRDVIKPLARSMFGRMLGFKDCLPATLDGFAEGGQSRKIGKGEFLVQAGEPFEMICLVVEGSLEVRILHGDGRRHLVHFLQPGDIAGLLTSCDGGPHHNDLIARVSNTQVFCVPNEVLNKLRERDPKLGRAFELQLAFRSRLLYDRLVADSSTDIQAKLARTILTLAKLYGRDRSDGTRLSFKASQSDFADLLGVSRQSINLALQQFKTDNVIALNYSSITIIDLPSLRACAGV